MGVTWSPEVVPFKPVLTDLALRILSLSSESLQETLVAVLLIWKRPFPYFFLSMFVVGISEGYCYLYVNFIYCYFGECIYQPQELSDIVLQIFHVWNHKITSSANKNPEALASSSPIYAHFLSFTVLLLWSRLQTLYWAGSGRSDIFLLFSL